MPAAKRAGIAGAALAVVSATALGVAKGIAMNDRRRDGRSKKQLLLDAGDTDITDADHHQLTMADGANIHVVSRGSGRTKSAQDPVLVLLHGVTLSSKIWKYTFDALGHDFHVVAPDWRGHGRSVAGSDGFGLEQLASDLSEILTQLDLRQCVIVGHSMGGMALMQFCGLHQAVLDERVKALMFLSTAAGDIGMATVPAALRGGVRSILGATPIARRASWTLPGDLGYTMVRATFGERPDPEWVEETRAIVAEMDSDATAASFVPLLSHDATNVLPQLQLPVMVVVGTEDRLTPPSQAKRIASLVPGAELVTLDGPGHMIMMERQTRLHQLLRQLCE
jgi:pimeloyl-ACP methyl ester carboxylesterase